MIEPVTLTGRKLAFSPSLLFSPPLAGIVMVFLIFYGIRLTQGRGNPILDKVLYIIGGWLLVSLVYLRAVFGFAYFGRSFKFFAPSVLADMAMISIVVGIGMIFGEYMRMRGESRGKTVNFAKNAIGGEGESARMLQTIAQKKDQVVEQEVQSDRQKPQGNIPLKYQGLASELKEWWRSEALEWWTRTGNSSAICDNGNESVPIHEGFLWGNRLICEDCLNGILAKYVDWPKAVTDVYKFFGSRVPNHIKLLAESLWDSPKASSSARFKMRIGSIMVSSRGVMVAGTPETNIVPNVGDTVQVVTGDGVLEAIVSKFNMLGNRYFCELDGFPPDKVKEGDILQA